MRRLLLLALLPLAGCALNMRLLEDGKAHQGKFSPASRSIEATIDGDFYTGPMSQGTSVGIGQAWSGGKMATGTMVGTNGQYSAVMTNKAGKVIRCQFQAALGAGTGVCQDNSGRTFDLVIGSMPNDPPSQYQTAPSGACSTYVNGRCS